MNDDDFKVHHCNDSAVHEDFMFGTRELSADGITKDGEIIPIFRHGNFIF